MVAPSLNLSALLMGEDVSPADSCDDEELIPARMLNEFAYCPRLAYLEWVQGEFTDNLDTRQGSFGHRVVDKPSARPIPASDETIDDEGLLEDDPSGVSELKTRSLTLSAPREGLVAKLDVLELDGLDATPIDYKKGEIPENPEQSWEPERVQLCAQGLILRENGYRCDQGELYYIASKRRVVIPFDDALVMRTRELIRRMREAARSRQIPPPLVNSPKCPRCSLVGICLPDETNLLRHDDLVQLETQLNPLAARNLFNAPVPNVRKLVPARDDSLPLYVKEQGASVGKDGDRIVVRPREGKPISVPLMDVSQVSLFGNVQMSTQVIREVVDRGIPVCHFSYGGWFHAITTGHVHKNIELRMAQFAIAADPARSLPIAKGFITAKIKNSRTMLRRHNGEHLKRELDQLAEWVQKAERADSAETLLGLEGMAAKVYFAGFAGLLKGDEKFDFNSRNRRPPRDPVNALLSFVYSLLAKELTIAVHSVGFDPLLGFFHRPRYGRPSLALDLAEEFRPIIADSTVLMLINNGEVSSSSFLARAGAVALTEPGRKAVIAAFERRMEQEITHPIFGYKISYRRVLEVQARLLSRVLLGEIAEYPGFCTR